MFPARRLCNIRHLIRSQLFARSYILLCRNYRSMFTFHLKGYLDLVFICGSVSVAVCTVMGIKGYLACYLVIWIIGNGLILTIFQNRPILEGISTRCVNCSFCRPANRCVGRKVLNCACLFLILRIICRQRIIECTC